MRSSGRGREKQGIDMPSALLHLEKVVPEGRIRRSGLSSAIA